MPQRGNHSPYSGYQTAYPLIAEKVTKSKKKEKKKEQNPTALLTFCSASAAGTICQIKTILILNSFSVCFSVPYRVWVAIRSNTVVPFASISTISIGYLQNQTNPYYHHHNSPSRKGVSLELASNYSIIFTCSSVHSICTLFFSLASNLRKYSVYAFGKSELYMLKSHTGCKQI